MFRGMSSDTLLVIDESQMLLSGGLLLKYSGGIGELPLEPGAGPSSHTVNVLGWHVVFLEQGNT